MDVLSPSVTGIDEAIERIRKTHTGNWGESIELEGDFGDLYSNQCCQPPESLGPKRENSPNEIAVGLRKIVGLILGRNGNC